MIITFLAVLIVGNAVENQLIMIPASGEAVFADNDRESYFSHHGPAVDYHLYGANKWAVRFSFRSAYPNVAHCSFSIQKARLYFPNIGDSVTVSLYSEAYAMPSQFITSARAAVSANVIDIPFPQTVQAEVVWLVVDYNTNLSSRYVGASNGDGSHSFYLNTNAITPYFQNFSTAGFNSELLFGLLGNFNLDNPDLQLVSFDLSGNLRPRESVKPVFKIYNHSNLPITDAQINLDISAPIEDYHVTRTITISETIMPQTLFEVLAPGYQDYSITMPNTGMQLRLQATLSSSVAESDTTLANNTIGKYLSVFAYGYPTYPVESFLRYDATSTICAIQDSYPQTNVHPLIFYPNLADTLSNLGAYQRNTWYGFNATPTTAVLGKERIIGFNAADYLTKYQAAVTTAKAKRSFISSATCSLTEATNNENLSINIQLNNANTVLYTLATINPVTSSRFFVGLFKKISIAGQQRYVFDRWVAFADTINNTMNSGSVANKAYNLSLVNLTMEELQASYRIYYWLQDKLGGQIHYANYTNFALTATNLQDEALVPAVSLKASPNPLRSGNNIKLTGIPVHASISIYNLRGQCIWKGMAQNDKLLLPASVFSSTGLYFIKSESANGQHKQTIKISYIK
jgi:hypothetical protein